MCRLKSYADDTLALRGYAVILLLPTTLMVFVLLTCTVWRFLAGFPQVAKLTNRTRTCSTRSAHTRRCTRTRVFPYVARMDTVVAGANTVMGYGYGHDGHGYAVANMGMGEPSGVVMGTAMDAVHIFHSLGGERQASMLGMQNNLCHRNFISFFLDKGI